MGLGKQRHERRSRHLGVVGLAVGCAPGWGIVSISLMERRADTMGRASACACFSMGFGRRRHERLGVAIVFLALAPFAPAAGPSRSHPRLGRSRWTPQRGIHSWGAPWGFLPSRPGRLAGHSSDPWRAPFVLPGIHPVLGARLHPSGRLLVASLAIGPAPPSEACFADAHGLVGACVVMLAVVSRLRRGCPGAVAPTIAAVAVTLPSRCSSAVAVTLQSRSCRQPPRVRTSRNPAPHQPCRPPLAS
jgi:hypothetical protein